MAKKFNLAIGDKIEFPITLVLADGAGSKTFKFHLEARRISADELNDQITPGTEVGEKQVTDVVKTLVTGWREQRLILDEEGNPAEFSVDALEAMLAVSGVANVIYVTYLKAVLASSGAKGVQKN